MEFAEYFLFYLVRYQTLQSRVCFFLSISTVPSKSCPQPLVPFGTAVMKNNAKRRGDMAIIVLNYPDYICSHSIVHTNLPLRELF